MIGQKHGMLTAVERLPGSVLRCVCDCGAERIVRTGHFNTGVYKSCGCHVVRHGEAKNKHKTRTYTSYHNMKARCLNPSNKRYKDYGAKGITVCQRWADSFVAFLSDMGECPHGYTIDRIDNTKGYYPENCRWASREENQRNRMLSSVWIVHGKEFETAADAGTAVGVSEATINAWCKGRTAKGRYYPPKDGCGLKPKYGDKNEGA